MKLKFVIGATLFISLIGAIMLGVVVDSLSEGTTGCPEGSEAVIYLSSSGTRGGQSSTAMCESPVEEWDRSITKIAVIACWLLGPVFVLMLLVVYFKPNINRDGWYSSSGLLALAIAVGGLSYERITDPTDNPEHMFVDENLSNAIGKIEEYLLEPLLVGEIVIGTKSVSADRVFAEDPQIRESIEFEDGEVHRGREKKNGYNNRHSFFASEVPWKRIPSLLLIALEVAQVDGGRISYVRVEAPKENELEIKVDIEGFEYKATVFFDQDGNQVSMTKKLQE